MQKELMARSIVAAIRSHRHSAFCIEGRCLAARRLALTITRNLGFVRFFLNFAKHALEVLDVIVDCMTPGRALDYLDREDVLGKGSAVRDRQHAVYQGCLVAVGKEQAAPPVLHHLSQSTTRACDHWYSAHDSLDGDQPKRLGPQRWCHQCPGIRELFLDFCRLKPTGECHITRNAKLVGKPLQRQPKRPATNDPKADRTHRAEDPRERTEEQWHTLFHVEATTENECR
jgi:hypothetical protein